MLKHPQREYLHFGCVQAVRKCRTFVFFIVTSIWCFEDSFIFFFLFRRGSISETYIQHEAQNYFGIEMRPLSQRCPLRGGADKVNDRFRAPKKMLTTRECEDWGGSSNDRKDRLR